MKFLANYLQPGFFVTGSCPELDSGYQEESKKKIVLGVDSGSLDPLSESESEAGSPE
jgi:hypothetical protein